MIKTMPLPEVLKRMSGDSARRKAELIHAARDAHYFPLSEKWQPTGYHISTGARIEARPWGRSFRWRLNGFASDGSDVL